LSWKGNTAFILFSFPGFGTSPYYVGGAFPEMHLPETAWKAARAQPRGEVAMTALEAEVLADLARRLDRLRPDHRDPERFHIEKDEIAFELRRLARAAERGHRGADRRGAG
jgi:hypothetical protein